MGRDSAVKKGRDERARLDYNEETRKEAPIVVGKRIEVTNATTVPNDLTDEEVEFVQKHVIEKLNEAFNDAVYEGIGMAITFHRTMVEVQRPPG